MPKKKTFKSERWTENDRYLFREGTHRRLWEKLGAHPATVGKQNGYEFHLWAPAAKELSVVGEFNGWQPGKNPMVQEKESGVWSAFVPGLKAGSLYKFHLVSKLDGVVVDKADPFARAAELPPQTASVTASLKYDWQDSDWIEARPSLNSSTAPMSIYELHLGSWKRHDGVSLSYGELTEQLVPYLTQMQFTHVEFLPPMEHPYYGSWGYQCVSFFAPTARYGSAEEFMALIDALHSAGIGVVLDWVPSHFPGDEHGLYQFDGTHLFEHADPKLGFHPDWKSHIFNYGRAEVRSFLISSALFWIETFHVDAIRVDAVASMLYRDYSREEGEWIPNRYGGRENLEAIAFLREFNDAIHAQHPGVITIAEESTSWPMVSRPTYLGGLGFDMKWDMGWMHDTLNYFRHDPIHRKFHHDSLTFRMMYAWSEQFVLPLSHDEVVHGKGSLLAKMAGDEWQKFANLRALYGYMFGLPGKKLLFMGAEIAPWTEWDHEKELEWSLTDYPHHAGMQRWVTDLNRLYREQGALQRDFDPRGFSWLDCQDSDQSVLSFERTDEEDRSILIICNFTPVPRHNYRIGVRRPGSYVKRLNSDEEIYSGSGFEVENDRFESMPIRCHERNDSICITLPPLATLFLVFDRPAETQKLDIP